VPRRICVALVLSLLVGGTIVALIHPPCAALSLTAELLPTGYDEAQQLIEAINQARWDNGQLPPLKRAAELDTAAQRHSQDMSDNNFFDHVGSDGSQFWERMQDAGYTNLLVAGENIAAGYNSAQSVIDNWMVSAAGHRENVLSLDAREMGVGYVYEPGDTYPPDKPWAYLRYWTLDLGARQGVYPVVINREAYSTTSHTVDLYLYGAGWADEMRFSDDGGSWSNWETFNPAKTWELSGGNGLKTVWAQIRRQSNETKTASDTILLHAPAPVLDVSPASLIFLAQLGDGATTPASGSFRVSNLGTGSLNWSVNPQDGWIHAAPLFGSGAADVSVWVQDLSTLGPGLHSGTLVVSSDSPEVQNSPQAITVTVSVVDELRFVYLPLLCK
jgi:uncharacterized protein YkwD